MIEYVTLLILLLSLYVFYRYYYRPMQEIKRYKTIFEQLGYKVFQQDFAFLGLSMMNYWARATKLHKDAYYYQRTIYPSYDISIGNIMDKVLINIIHPDLAQEFLAGNTVFKYPKYQMLISSIKIAIGEGIVFSQGHSWKGKRKIMSKLFNFELIIKNIPKMCSLCDKYLQYFDERSKIGENAYKYDVKKYGTSLFNGIIMKCFLGVDQIKEDVKGMKYEDFFVYTISQATKLATTPLMVFMGKLAWKLGLTKRIREVKENVGIMRQKAEEIIEARTKEVLNSPRDKCTDIIQALVYEGLDNKQQLSYSKQDLVDEFQTFLLAGTDTTTHYFTMAVYYLGKYPQVHKKVREEVNSLIKSNDDINHQNLKKMVYLDYFQRQVTRHYGPSTRIFERIAIEDNLIKDLPIKKGTLVNFQNKGIHYSQKYYKDPQLFKPERWESQCDNLHPFAFTGFSGGTRTCLGKHLALLESKIAIVKLIMHYETIEVPSSITMIKGFVYQAQPFETIFTKMPTKQ